MRLWNSLIRHIFGLLLMCIKWHSIVSNATKLSWINWCTLTILCTLCSIITLQVSELLDNDLFIAILHWNGRNFCIQLHSKFEMMETNGKHTNLNYWLHCRIYVKYICILRKVKKSLNNVKIKSTKNVTEELRSISDGKK